MNLISFPNIGIDNLHINRVAFSIFGRDIYWYGLIITFSIVIAFAYVLWRAKQEYIKSDDIFDLAIWVIVFGIIGARAYYVLTSLDKYDSFLDALKIWEGGLGFYGCIIGGALACVIVAKIKKISFAVIFDMLSPAVLIAQAIGRWGNFFNAEAYGSASTMDFFGKTFDVSGVVNAPWIMKIGSTLVQPTFLYECIWGVIGFIIINSFYRKKKFNGQVFLWYIAWNGFGRMLIEGLRTDSLYIGSIRISQLVGLLGFIFGIVLNFVFLAMAKKGKLAVPFTRTEMAGAKAKTADAEPAEQGSAQTTNEEQPAQSQFDGGEEEKAEDKNHLENQENSEDTPSESEKERTNGEDYQR